MAELPSTIGRYEVVSRLGQGGMGSLYLAKDPKIGRLLAIKLVRADFDSPEARQRFEREAQSAGTLRHPNIVTIFDVDEHQGSPFIAMEYIDGETLSEVVRRRAPFTLARRLKWVEELCAALAYAHRQGIIHRDIKPANLIVDNEGALKILDFGLARTEHSKFTQSQTLIGTPNYMAPEQIRAGDIGPRSDIFAVGAVLYEIIAYAEAFPGSVHQAMHKVMNEDPVPLDHLQPGLDPALIAIVARALEKEPARRYQDLTTMKNELALVRQRLESHVDDDARTLVTPAPGALPTRAVTPPSSSGPVAGAPRVADTHRLSLQKKRAAQIEAFLTDARKSFDEGALDKAKDSIEQALMFDPEHTVAIQLLDEIAAEEERRQIAEFVAAARRELQQGHLDKAERIVGEALQFAPQSTEIQQLRETVDTARKEIERVRHIQDMLRRARARFAEGSFEGAIRAVGELLAIDPGNVAALDLQTRAHEALETRARRAERDAAAQAAVSEARALFDKGDKDAAIAKLEAFTPAHDLVTGFLASLRSEQVAEALPESVPEPEPVPAGPPTAAFMPGRSKEHPAVHVGSGSRMPIYAGVTMALVVLFAVGWWVMTRPREVAGDTTASVNVPPAGAPSTVPAPASTSPAIPAPPVVTAPAALSENPAKTQNDRDAMQAYALLGSGDHAGAAKIAAQIAKRDSKDGNLPGLRAAIQKAVEYEKQRADALAAVAAANAARSTTAAPATPPPAPVQPAPSSAASTEAAPVPPKPAATDPVLTVLPGAGFAATSEPAPPPLLAEVERPAIEAAIAQYAKALSAQDLKAVSQVRTYTPAEAQAWQSAFKALKAYEIAVKVLGPPVVEPTGDKATIPVEERILQTQKNGMQIVLNPRRITYKLEKIGGRWRILPPGQ